ncbi:terpenoid synthase [Exidia glandulosa HHB12029]|uniref:Terpenoid synthase n=1 Tax=Exidia glandulosa HHB12029 TaxID=1314781 RepID=A0A166A0C7_EXIGL|nr:terpenoid synthase [Exidia glandulosa HHB12029]
MTSLLYNVSRLSYRLVDEVRDDVALQSPSRLTRSDGDIRGEIREVVLHFLQEIDVGYPGSLPDYQELYADCCDRARLYGFPMAGTWNLAPYIDAGVVMAACAYQHTPYENRVFVALYTAAFLQLDVLGETELDGCANFVSCMLQAKAQKIPSLDALTSFLRDIATYCVPVVGELSLAAGINFIAAIAIEDLSKDMIGHPEAEGYAAYKRYLDGLGDCYAGTIFPPEIPLVDYLQALPEISKLCCAANDVLSFYKEELAGETDNVVGNRARAGGISHIEAYKKVTADCIELHKKIVMILSGSPAAVSAYKAWLPGYVQFHTSLDRYRLDELQIPVGAPSKSQRANQRV